MDSRAVVPDRAMLSRRPVLAAWSRRLRPAFAAGRELPRALAGLLAGLSSLATLPATGIEAGRIRPSAGLAFATGAAFGAPGIALFAVGHFVALSAVAPSPVTAALVALSDGILGAVGWLAFRDGGRVGRGLPDLRSYLWLVAAGLAGSLLTALFLAWSDVAGRLPQGVGLFAVGSFTGIVFVGLPALLVADRLARPWMTPIAGEIPAGPLRPVEHRTAEPPAPFVDVEATLLIRRLPEKPVRELVVCGSAILAITLFAAPLAAVAPVEGSWVALLYLLPVVGAAQAFGLRGGVFAASLSGALFLAATRLVSAFAGDEGGGGGQHLALYAQLLLLSPLGAYLGQARQQEIGLRAEVSAQNRLLHDDLVRVVRALTAAVEAKDAYTESHLRRVGDYAVEVGSRLGVAGRDLETLYYASMLHDIGKIGVPESVLRKEGPLDEAEREQMERHPEIGARIVGGLDLLRDAAPLILHHQERWDGGGDGTFRGYPDGLTQTAIPLGSRIIAVVDAFDAMTTDRPYRAALPIERAVTELRAEAGRQFDPQVVEAFLAVLAERPWG